MTARLQKIPEKVTNQSEHQALQEVMPPNLQTRHIVVVLQPTGARQAVAERKSRRGKVVKLRRISYRETSM